jgi:hypothetical protein
MVFSKLTYYKAVRVGCVYYCSTSSTYYTAVRVGCVCVYYCRT